MITQKILAQLLDKATDPHVHSIELGWTGAQFESGPHPVIKITRKDDSYVPLQLCPKCNGDGRMDYTYLGMAEVVLEGIKDCDLCNGNKVIPMIKEE